MASAIPPGSKNRCPGYLLSIFHWTASEAIYPQGQHSMRIKPELLAAVRGLITQAREQAVRAVDAERVLLYWHIGQVILEEE